MLMLCGGRLRLKEALQCGAKPLKLIRLDYYKTKQYNYHCNLGYQFNHLTFEVINYSQRGCRLFGANLTKILQ